VTQVLLVSQPVVAVSPCIGIVPPGGSLSAALGQLLPDLLTM
jgi:hypothetical protein